MSSLSDKLKALGVKVGAQDLARPALDAPAGPPSPLESMLAGHMQRNPQGECFVVEKTYPLDAPYGQARLSMRPNRRVLAAWAHAESVADLPMEAFAFLDTETTGLSGGTGTLAFLIGAGRFYDGQFHLMQFFLRDPLHEPGQLAALEAFLAPCQAIVTFNGKAFDAPLLITRYTAHGWRHPLHGLAHVDLLHLARRLWKDRLPSRTLGNLEAHILGQLRSEDDVPGWMIPSLYADYLRTGDVSQLVKVFYHNAIDVVSMAALMDHMAGLLDDPLGQGGHYGVDLVALARLFEDLGDLEQAGKLYLHGLEHDDARNERMPRSVVLQALNRLAAIHKRQAGWEAAIALWEQAANRRQLEACVELCKCYEHQIKDYPQALRWAEAAIALVDTASPRPNDENYLGQYERRRWREQLEHRRTRLKKKLA